MQMLVTPVVQMLRSPSLCQCLAANGCPPASNATIVRADEPARGAAAGRAFGGVEERDTTGGAAVDVERVRAG